LVDEIASEPDAVTYGYVASDSVEVLEMLLHASIPSQSIVKLIENAEKR
jgi:hypothetical protein